MLLRRNGQPLTVRLRYQIFLRPRSIGNMKEWGLRTEAHNSRDLGVSAKKCFNTEILPRDIAINTYSFRGTSSWLRNIILVSNDKLSLRTNKNVLKKWLTLKNSFFINIQDLISHRTLKMELKFSTLKEAVKYFKF